MVRRYVFVPLCAFLTLCVLASSASAADITVTTFEDQFNEDDECSLREAVYAANNNEAISGCAAGDEDSVGPDTITLGAGNYTLSIACDFDLCELGADDIFCSFEQSDFGTQCGDLDITGDVVINGAGQGTTVINVEPEERSYSDDTDSIEINNGFESFYFRVFDIDQPRHFGDIETAEDEDRCAEGCSAGLEVTISNMTLSGGEDDRGGAIHFDGGNGNDCEYTSLTLTNVTATENNAHYSGGAVAGYGQLVVSNSDINNNVAGRINEIDRNGGGSETEGGGIYLTGPESSCYGKFTSTISDSTITENKSLYGDGGGVFNSYMSNLDITDTTIDSNEASFRGAGIFNGISNLNITGGSISGNAGVQGEVLLAEEDDEDPRVQFGGGIYNAVEDQGGLRAREIDEFRSNDVTVTGTTIANNKARYQGGGIANQDRFDSCFQFSSAGIDASGFSVCAEDELDLEPTVVPTSSFTLTDAVVSGNTLEPTDPRFFFKQIFETQGAGIYHGRYAGKFVIVDTTIADNVGGITGGGIENEWVMEVTGSTISGNQTAEQFLFIFDDLASDEIGFRMTSSGGGGGASNSGSLIMANSTVSGNSTYGIGGGVRNSMSESYYFTYRETNDVDEDPSPSPSPFDTPFSDDDDDDDDDFSERYSLEPLPIPGAQLRNVTVTDNSILEFSEPPVMELDDEDDINAGRYVSVMSLVVNNGGGVASAGGPIRLRNTIVAGNSDDSENIVPELDIFRPTVTGSPTPFDDPTPFPSVEPTPFPTPDFDSVASNAPDCWVRPEEEEFFCEDFSCEDFLPRIISEQHNLIGDNTNCEPFASVDNEDADKIGTGDSPIDPLLGPLADNGGATQTHELLDDSPAIDMGNMMGSVIEGAIIDVDPATFACEATDQRGTARPQDGDLDGTATCDIGSFERVRAPDPTPTPTPEPDPLVCETVDITETQFALDGSANDAEALAKRLRRILRRKTGKNGAGSALLSNVSALRIENWGFAWSLPAQVLLNCTGATDTCVEVSNAGPLAEYIANANEMSDSIKSLIRKLRRAGISRKRRRRFTTRNADILASAIASTESVPATTTSCS